MSPSVKTEEEKRGDQGSGREQSETMGNVCS